MTPVAINPAWRKSKLLAELSRTNEYLAFAEKIKQPPHSYGVRRAINYKGRLLVAIAAKAAPTPTGD